jgi:chromosome segregation ATPase
MLNDYLDLNGQKQTAGQRKGSVENPALSELQDAEAYYTSQINSKQAELAAYASEHPEIIADLKMEFSEMDKKKAELKDDLKESNADEKVIEAIILSYRVKLEILDQMLSELQRSGDPERDQKPLQTDL